VEVFLGTNHPQSDLPRPTQQQRKVAIVESDNERRIRLQIRHRFLAYLRTNKNKCSNNNNRKKQMEMMIKYANALSKLWDLPVVSLSSFTTATTVGAAATATTGTVSAKATAKTASCTSSFMSKKMISKARNIRKSRKGKDLLLGDNDEISNEMDTTTASTGIQGEQKLLSSSSSSVQQNLGTWNRSERIAFWEGYMMYGFPEWKHIATLIPTRYVGNIVNIFFQSIFFYFRLLFPTITILFFSSHS
jgi:hypothetical protein